MVILLRVRFSKKDIKYFGNSINRNLHFKRQHNFVNNYFQTVNNSYIQFSSPLTSIQKKLSQSASAGEDKCDEHPFRSQR